MERGAYSEYQSVAGSNQFFPFPLWLIHNGSKTIQAEPIVYNLISLRI